MGTGPAGVGVLQTSGKAMDWPLEPLWTMPRRLQKVVCPMNTSRSRDEQRRARAAIGGSIYQGRRGPIGVGDAVGGQRNQQGAGGRAGVAVTIGGVKYF